MKLQRFSVLEGGNNIAYILYEHGNLFILTLGVFKNSFNLESTSTSSCEVLSAKRLQREQGFQRRGSIDNGERSKHGRRLRIQDSRQSHIKKQDAERGHGEMVSSAFSPGYKHASKQNDRDNVGWEAKTAFAQKSKAKWS